MSLIDALQNATRSVLCGTLGTWDSGVSFARDAYRIPDLVPNPARQLNCLVCGGCDRPSPPSTPNAGGQCPVNYNFTVSYRINRTSGSVSNNTTGSRTLLGPIRSLYVRETSTAFLITVSHATPAIQTTVETVLKNAGGGVFTQSVSNLSFPTMVRQDGQADNCGNAPTPIPPPYPSNPAPVVVPVTYVDVYGITNNISPSIQVFAPIVGSFNNLFAPVRITLPDVTFNGNLELFPDLNLNIKPEFNFGSPGKPDSPVPPTGNPGDDEPTDEDDDDPPLPIIGAHVRATVTSAYRATNLAQGVAPNLFVPRLGSLYFRVRIGNALSWTSDIPIKTVSQYVPCPELRGAIAVRSWADTGVTLNVTPVRGLPIATER